MRKIPLSHNIITGSKAVNRNLFRVGVFFPSLSLLSLPQSLPSFFLLFARLEDPAKAFGGALLALPAGERPQTPFWYIYSPENASGDCKYRPIPVNSLIFSIFTSLHAMQTRSSDENSVRLSVRPSVRLSVTRVYCDKTVERSVQIFIHVPYERTFSLVF